MRNTRRPASWDEVCRHAAGRRHYNSVRHCRALIRRHAVVRFWGESDTTSWPGGSSPTQQRFEKSLLPTGTTRSLTVSAKPAWPIGFVTIRGQVIYPATTEAATTEVAFSKRVLVVDARAIVVLVGLLALAFLGWWWRRRRRSRAHPAPAR